MFSSFFNAGKPTYQIEQSLRFDGSSYLQLSTLTSAATFTLSFWTKGEPSGNFFSCGNRSTGNIKGLEGQRLTLASGQYVVAPGNNRDYSAWRHVVCGHDGTNAFIYYNGVESVTGSVSSSSFTDFYIGQEQGGSNLIEGYMSEVHYVDGTALDPTDFGEFDDNGVWRPIEVSGITYGSNGFYLKFDPSATNGIGHDHSGNGNNFTATGFTTSGTGTDVMSDTPTTNYPTINPIAALDAGEPYNITGIKNGNLDVDNVLAAGSGNNTVVATFQVPISGKWYWEVTCREYSTAAPTRTSIGVMSNACIGQDAGDFVYADVAGVYSYAASGVKCTSPSLGTSSYGSSYGNGDVIGVAFDADNGDLYFYKNGTAQNSGTAAFTGLDMTDGFYPAVGYWGDFTFNFGQRAFEYTVPTGYKALNTSNLPAPTVKDGSDYFNTILWAGDNANPRTLTGVGFQPDWVWLKDRTQSTNHRLVDAVRGAGNTLKSNLTSAETSSEIAGTITAFTSDGFTVEGTSNVEGVNLSGDNFVAWNWLAGGSGSSNTDGSITSTVSANPSAGFSIVSFNSGTAGNKTVGHGLGVAPAMYVTKKRDSAGSWSVFHQAFANPAQGYMLLNSQNGVVNDSRERANAAPTSTVFSFESGYTFAANEDIIAYCFAEVKGYSKFGSYTGNGSSDGPFIYTGFKPAWLMVKKDAASTDWKIYDAGREPYNVMSARLAANTSNAELSGNAQEIDFVSNGFKFRGTNGDQNSSGTFYYVAFASSPFGGSGVSPATAR